jgi:hypothetical protein
VIGVVKIDDITNEISKYLRQYTQEVQDEVKQASDDVTKDGVKQLKSTSPKDSGKYAKGWTRKKQGEGYVIHNKVYQLTHLLEKGHAKRGGGRVAPRVHIAPVEEKMIKDFEKRIERAIKS